MVWQEVKQANNPRPYYYNLETKKTSWIKPLELYSEREVQIYDKGWRVLTTEKGKVYYSNAELKKSSWEFPIIDDDKKEEVKTTGGKEVQEGDAKKDGDNLDRPDKKHTLESKSAKGHHLDVLQLRTEYSYLQNKKPRVKSIEQNDKEAAKQLFRDSFIKMLKDNHVDSTWSFQKIIKDLSTTDKRYWPAQQEEGIDFHEFNNPLFKKKVFEEYLNNRTEHELMREKENLQKFKIQFSEMLQKHVEQGDIKYYSKWITVKKKYLMNEPFFKDSVTIDDTLKRSIFQEKVHSLRQANELQLQNLKSKAFLELDTYFQTIVQTETNATEWSYILEKYISGNKQFESNKNFKRLTILDIFQRYLETIQEKYNKLQEESKIFKEKSYTRERIVRDCYLQRLKELPIYSNTLWSDIYLSLSNDAVFLKLLAIDFKQPIDYFACYIDDLKIEMSSLATSFQQIIRNEAGKVSISAFSSAKEYYQEILKTHTANSKSNFSKLNKCQTDIIIDIVWNENKNIIKQDLSHKLHVQKDKLHKAEDAWNLLNDLDKFVLENDVNQILSVYNTYMDTHNATKNAASALQLKRSKRNYNELDY